MSEEAFSALIDMVKQNGADDADILMQKTTSLNVTYRLGKVEQIEREEKSGIGLRVFVGQKQALVSTYDFSPDHLAFLAGQCIDMAKASPDNPYAGLPGPKATAKATPNLSTFDTTEGDIKEMTERAAKCEDAARSIEGVTNSEGASCWWSSSIFTYANSQGFFNEYGKTSHGTSVSVLAGKGTEMERDYDYATTTHLEDLDDAALIGQRAGQKVVMRLNPQSIKTGTYPLLFSPRVGKSLLSDFLKAINGAAIAKESSFLKDKMGQPIFSDEVTILDTPNHFRGLRSKPFDAEGIRGNEISLVENGVLKSWLLDTATAKQLNLKNNGRASRGISSSPTPTHTNVRIRPGKTDTADLLKNVKNGIYITDMMGFGANTVSGDFSQGASGFLIENGEIKHPVNEFTIAGNLNDMFKNITLGNDLTYKYGVDTPTFLIEGMTVAGK